MRPRTRLPCSLLQEKILERLNLAVVGTVLEGKVYDQPPEGSPAPACLIGDMNVKPTGSKTRAELDVTTTLDIYSDAEGYQEVQALSDGVCQSLTISPLDLSSQQFRNDDVAFDSLQTSREFNGTMIRRRATLVFMWKILDVS